MSYELLLFISCENLEIQTLFVGRIRIYLKVLLFISCEQVQILFVGSIVLLFNGRPVA